MIRNRTTILIQSKIRQKGNRFHSRAQDALLHQPWWFEQYYQHKETLAAINANSKPLLT